MVLSQLPDKANFPSGLKATEDTAPAWPEKDLITFPVATSQSLRVLSLLPDKANFPSALKATEETGPAWLLEEGAVFFLRSAGFVVFFTPCFTTAPFAFFTGTLLLTETSFVFWTIGEDKVLTGAALQLLRSCAVLWQLLHFGNLAMMPFGCFSPWQSTQFGISLCCSLWQNAQVF
jgi:hypothetical protein